MSKNVVIFHGTNGSPDVCWYQWLGAALRGKGYEVEIPYYPTINKELIVDFLPRVLKAHIFTPDTVLVGHSGGGALLLSILEHLDIQIAQAVLVAGYATKPNVSDEPVLQDMYDWQKIRAHVKDIYFINSVTDPYGCDAEQGRYMFDKLGGTQIIRNDGHFGDYDQPYPTFELLNRLIPPARNPIL